MFKIPIGAKCSKVSKYSWRRWRQLRIESGLRKRVLVYDREAVEELLILTQVEAALIDQLNRVVKRRAKLLSRLQVLEVVHGHRHSQSA